MQDHHGRSNHPRQDRKDQRYVELGTERTCEKYWQRSREISEHPGVKVATKERDQHPGMSEGTAEQSLRSQCGGYRKTGATVLVNHCSVQTSFTMVDAMVISFFDHGDLKILMVVEGVPQMSLVLFVNEFAPAELESRQKFKKSNGGSVSL